MLHLELFVQFFNALMGASLPLGITDFAALVEAVKSVSSCGRGFYKTSLSGERIEVRWTSPGPSEVVLAASRKGVHAAMVCFGHLLGLITLNKEGEWMGRLFDPSTWDGAGLCAPAKDPCGIPGEFIALMAELSMCPVCGRQGARPNPNGEWCTHPGFATWGECEAVRRLGYLSRHVPIIVLETGEKAGTAIATLRLRNPDGTVPMLDRGDGANGHWVPAPDPVVADLGNGVLLDPKVQEAIEDLCKEVREFQEDGNDTPSCLLDWIGQELVDLLWGEEGAA